jgi:hypothetical protein
MARTKNTFRITVPTGVTYRDGMFEVPVNIGIERAGRIVRWEQRTLRVSEYSMTAIVRGAQAALRTARAGIEERIARLREAAA